jgi:sigma-B regulation protein RsbU (phosphoserine phosphatase)
VSRGIAVPLRRTASLRAFVLACLVLGGFARSAAQAAHDVDLTALDFWVRPGFSIEWTYYEPDAADKAWIRVPARPGNRPVVVRDLPLPGKEARTRFAISPARAQEYCMVCVFNADPELLETSTGVGLYLADIGKDWQIFLNGSIIQTEVYLDRQGAIERERAVHGALVDVDKRFLQPGKNVLAFMIIGDASDGRTGLFAPGPYLFGDYQRLLRLKSEYIDLMLIGLFLFFGVYHLILFGLRPANRQYLFYGLGTLAFALYLFARSFIVFSMIADTALIRGLELSTLFLVFPLFLAFFDTCNRGRITPFTTVVGIASLAIAFLAPFIWGEFFLQAWRTVLPLLIAYLVAFDVALPAAGRLRGRDAGSFGDRLRRLSSAGNFWTIIIAAALSILCVIAALVDLDSAAVFAAIKIGAFVLIFGTAAVLASRFTGLFRDVEELTTGLEAKVQERTSALATAMEEQSSLNENLQAANSSLETAMGAAERDMRIAVQVQRGLFQQSPPELDDWSLSFVFLPKSGVSGDFYDFYVRDRHLEGIILGDVSGRGISSGLITVLARSIFYRGFYELAAHSLGRMIEEMNAELSTELSAVENYLTATLLRFQGASVEYANAGNTDLAFRRAGKARANLVVPAGAEDFRGPPLGREGIVAPYRSIKFSVAPGDSLLLYTDCLVSAADDEGRPFGAEGILSAYGRAPTDSAADMLEYIIEDWRFHLGEGEVPDDLTALLLVRK